MLNKSQWNTIIVISQQQMLATSIPSHSLSCFFPCSLFRPQYSRRVFKGLLCVLLAPGFPVQDQIWDYIAVNINPREIRYVCLADHVSVCLYERLWLVWPGYWEGLLISGSNPAGFFLHVEPCQRIGSIWWADLRFRGASVCVRVCLIPGDWEGVWFVPFVHFLKAVSRCEHCSCRYMCARLHPICARGLSARWGPGVWN